MLFSGGMAFTAFYNVLDFPAGVVPVTKVSKKDIDDSKNFPTPHGPEKVAKEVSQSVGTDLSMSTHNLASIWRKNKYMSLQNLLKVT